MEGAYSFGQAGSDLANGFSWAMGQFAGPGLEDAAAGAAPGFVPTMTIVSGVASMVAGGATIYFSAGTGSAPGLIMWSYGSAQLGLGIQQYSDALSGGASSIPSTPGQAFQNLYPRSVTASLVGTGMDMAPVAAGLRTMGSGGAGGGGTGAGSGGGGAGGMGGPLGAGKVEQCGGTASGGTTPVWRAVKPEELADLQAQGSFRNLGSAEGKYFSMTPEGAASYARQAVRGFGDPPYTLIKSEVPNNLLPPSVLVDRNVPAVVIPDDVLPHMRPQILDHLPVPPR